MNARRALVIGGSVGGLFAAHMLRAIGWEPHVYERVNDDLAGRGAGIGTHEELLSILRRLGIAVDDSLGVKVDSRICLDRGGRITHEVKMPQTMTAWARIHRALKQLLPQDYYHAGMSLERVAQQADSVTAVFADGTRASGDLLVGADGIRSTIRAQFAPDIGPRYAGYIAWRGIVDESAVSPTTRALMFEKYGLGLPDGEMILSYPVPGRDDDVRPGHRGCNFVWYHPTDEHSALPALCVDADGRRHGLAIAPPLIRPDVVESMRAEARALFAPQFVELIDCTRQPFFQPIFDLESERVVYSHVVLLGDAAFVARPHVGLGVTKAALDARCLAEAIVATGGDLDLALARYDKERRIFGSRVVARARQLGAYLQAQLKPRDQRTASELHQDPAVVMREIGAPLANIRELSGTAA
jgi:2-polyprenyl-6-methoxyphenol hydroxylase-like FAD-dependent oxidoreductase